MIEPIDEKAIKKPADQPKGRNVVKTILIILGILLLYAITIQVTQINLEKPLDENRQAALIRVMRLLADPDIVSVDEDTGNFAPSETTIITVERIIETILMALIASTVGTILAVPASFLAARNLMEDIVAPLASIMAAVIALAAGGAFGLYFSSQLLDVAGSVARNSIFSLPDVLGLLLAFFGGVVFTWLLARLRTFALPEESETQINRALNTILLLAIAASSILSLGFLAFLGLELGSWLRDVLQVGTVVGIDFFGFFGDMVFVLSDVLRLFLPVIVGLLSGLILASYASRYSQDAVLGWPNPPARALTAVLSLLGTTMVTLGIGIFWNWLYEYNSAQNTVVAPSIVGGLLIGILAFALIQLKSRLLHWLVLPIVTSASIAVLVSVSPALNRALGYDNQLYFAAIPALISGIVASLIAGLSRPKYPFKIGFAIYTVSRAILNVLRSIEPLIMGVVFVVWVSLGPFAGIMALTLHSIAALGKLFSEQVEGIDDGPVEAVTATGASRLQTVAFAVVPQIVPPFTAFALYRWDINVRMSTIIGFVGGGGIGFVLSQNIQQLRYRQASVMMLAIAIVVALLDYASARIRSRII